MILTRVQNIASTPAIELCASPDDCISNAKRYDLFRYLRWLMWSTAIRPVPLEDYLPKRLSTCSTVINVIWEIFLLLTVIHIFVLFVMTMYLNYEGGDLELLIRCAIQSMLYFWAIIIKVIFRRVRPELVADIMDYVSEEHVVHSAVGFTYVTMKECLEQLERGIRYFVICSLLAVIFWLFLPVVYEERTLPLPCWYPFDYKALFIYIPAYFLQIVAQLQLALTFVVSSVYFIALCSLLSGQFDLLNCSLKNILATTYILMGASRKELIELRKQQCIADDEINQYFVAKELRLNLDCIPHILNPTPTTEGTMQFRDAFRCALGHCVGHHIFILNALRKTEKLFNMVWFFKTLEVTFAICTIAFDVVKLSDDKSFMKALSLGQYLVLVLWEMFMICYGGEIIYVNSQRCDEAILRSPWYLHTREIRADFLFVLLHAQRAFALTGGKFYPLKLQKFQGILTTSFSFYTLLQNMGERN